MKKLSSGRSQALAAFHEISARMVGSLDLDETLLAIARAATLVLEADIGAIFLPEGDLPGLVARGVHGARSPRWERLRLSADRGLSTEALSGRPARTDDYVERALADPELANRDLVLEEPIRSAMAVPVRRRRQVIGSIGVYRRVVDPFDDEDEYLLQLLSQQAGIALDNAFAYGELEATRDRLQTAIEVAADLSRSLDPSEVIRRVLVRAVEAGRAERGVLLRVDGAETVVEDYHDVDAQPDMIGYRHPIAVQPLMRRAVTTRQPIIGGSYDTSKLEAALVGPMSVRHTATIPLELDGEVTAVMVLSRREDRPFRETDIDLFRLIGNQAVLALRNARLFAQAQAVTRAQSDFLNMAAHELRTPLSVISGYVSMMIDGTLGQPPQSWRLPLDTLRGKAEELEALISELLVASRLEAGTVPFQVSEIDLRDAAFAAIERARPRASMLNAELDHHFPAAPVRALADNDHVARILDNLLNNALSYSAERPRVKLVVAAGEQARIDVRDRGLGIPREEHQRIFERFYRIDDGSVRHVPGTGLGLYISRQLADRMGGTLTLEHSDRRQGSVFSLRLPSADPAIPQAPC